MGLIKFILSYLIHINMPMQRQNISEANSEDLPIIFRLGGLCYQMLLNWLNIIGFIECNEITTFKY